MFPKLVIALLTLDVVLTTVAFAQNNGSTGDPSLDAYIDAIRADLRSDKIEVIKAGMQFNEKDAAIFWPIYKNYETEQAKLNDKRIEGIKIYSDKWATLTDAEARDLAEKSLDLESRMADLRKKYFVNFNKVLPGAVVAKFFQLEYRLDLLVDLKIASELPALLARPPAMPGETNQTRPN
ncbi:MAG TPA: hypothetical protein VEK33_23550 [Terriglobales bacterium]|nr:hypothetical protein [Terriglobales bacterium]